MANHLSIIMLISGLLSALALARSDVSRAQAAVESQAKDPLLHASAEELVKGFMFIGDFDIKEETRPVGKEVFWRYPFTLPKIEFGFDLIEDLKSPKMLEIMPKTEGQGRAIQHINRGRVLFLDGQIDEARRTWLGGRARYGKEYDYHRRADYFIAQSFLRTGIDLLRQAQYQYQREDVRQSLVNASTFISWAFDRKRDLYDPVLDQVAPQMYYNQAVIYYNYERWAGVVGAATLGLDFLRKTGRQEYRRELRRMLAETHIRNRDYLEAVRELDLTLRQDEGLDTAALIFARIADLYFDLNNFELAEEVYAVASKIDRELKFVRPSQYVLRGESLFWMGRFEDAIKTMQYALQAASMPTQHQDPSAPVMPLAKDELDLDMQALASMRIADSWLALGNFEKARLAYFQQAQEFRSHQTGAAARLRLACLELPFYEGNNIEHARQLLAELKDQADIIPAPAQEMAWTCEMASYAQHERTPAMVDRVRTFAARYPESEFLQQLVRPVREVQSRHIEGYFAAGDAYGAVLFFEKTRNFLFPVVDEQLAAKLFTAYVDTNQSQKAREFIDAYRLQKIDDLGWLRLAAATAELGDLGGENARAAWEKQNRSLGLKLQDLGTQLKPEVKTLLYLNRILETSSAPAYYPWILAITMEWSKKDISIGCDRVYPLFERYRNRKLGDFPEEIKLEAEEFIDKNLKDLLRFETNCAYSLMELEVILFESKIAALAKKYLQRDFVMINATTVGTMWSIAERCFNAGHRAEAEAMWRLIVERGDRNWAEVRYSRSRLDNRKTELEGLWER